VSDCGKRDLFNSELSEKRVRLEPLIARLRPGIIVEFGCGSGFILEMVSEQFPDSIIIGVDQRFDRLRNVAEKGLKNVIPVSGDITGPLFLANTFDSGLFIAVLHEIFSRSGKRGLTQALKLAHDVLKKEGILLIQDFLKPEPEPVELIFRSKAIEARFYRFAREYRPRRINFERIDDGVRIDAADAVEFVCKCHATDEGHWQEEMGETHFFFTEAEYLEVVRRIGFTVVEMRKVQRIKDWRPEVGDELEVRSIHPYPDRWIQLILKKRCDLPGAGCLRTCLPIHAGE